SSDISREQLSVSFSGGFTFSLVGTALANANTVKVENLTDKTAADNVAVTDNAVSSEYVSAGAKLLRITSGQTTVYAVVTVTEPVFTNVDVNYGAAYVLNTAAEDGITIDLDLLKNGANQPIGLAVGAIDTILVNGFMTAYTALDATTVKIGAAANVGELTIKLNTANTSYIFDLIAADYVLDSWDNWRAVASHTYTVLDADLTNTAGTLIPASGWSAFNGTFNGMGHTIYDAKTSHGLFYSQSSGPFVLKNVTFENFEYRYQGPLSENTNFALTVDNVHFTLNLSQVPSDTNRGDRNILGGMIGNIRNSSFIVVTASPIPIIKIYHVNYETKMTLNNVLIASVGQMIARPGEKDTKGDYSVSASGGTPPRWTDVTIEDNAVYAAASASAFAFGLTGTPFEEAESLDVTTLKTPDGLVETPSPMTLTPTDGVVSISGLTDGVYFFRVTDGTTTICLCLAVSIAQQT
ncbi:MAG: hypothetical protein LBH24_06295, partial [Clostridiales bacterium]|nr:hypothetical protein [Clostridiales bacterium]